MIKTIIGSLKNIFIFIGIALLALVLRWSIIEVYVMPRQGMMPTLLVNDHIIVNKMAYGLRVPFSSAYVSKWAQPKRGDVIVFRSPFDSSALSIRRVIGLPGDRVFFENGNLYVNEQKVVKSVPAQRKKDFSWLRDEDFSNGGITEEKEDYIHWEEVISDYTYSVLLKRKKRGYLIFGPYRVPPNYYFVMGDHRDRSQDSRTWPAQIKKAKGVVTFSRAHPGVSVFIPKGTIVRTNNLKMPEYFETQKDVTLNGVFVDVEVKARKAGLGGNVQMGQINFIESVLPKTLSVSNAHHLTGGEDQNFVLESDILGKLSKIWFSCEKTFSSVDFLCDPRYIRWNRMFFSVHHKKVIQK